MEPDRPLGVHAVAAYLPRPRVDLGAWSQWAGADPAKIRAVTGTGFRMPGPREDALTMAAAAVMRLVRSGSVDPARVGYLALATESARDGAVGAVVVKGLVDRALRAEGRAPLARACEVPEFKQACLAGVYGLQGALRWLALDGRGREAVVVASDVASYDPGSTGEPTQGAGAVAVALRQDPALLELDPAAWASTSDFRGVDFRKPLLRHVMGIPPGRGGRLLDRPVFDGPWSTSCYLDETLRAVEALAERLGTRLGVLLRQADLAVFHRPYRKMPRDALALLRLRVEADRGDASFHLMCEAAGTTAPAVRAELEAGPRPGAGGGEAWPAVAAVLREARGREAWMREGAALLGLGEATMAECGNLYAASILAWAGAALEEAAAAGRDLAGARMLWVGYGSGDAATAMVSRVADGWKGASGGVTGALAGALDLDREAYRALHAGEPVPGLPDLSSDGFAVHRTGFRASGRAPDLGVEHHEYEPGWAARAP